MESKEFEELLRSFFGHTDSRIKEKDSKKIYSRFFENEISNVAGLDIEVDQPSCPDQLVPFNPKSVQTLANDIIKSINLKKNENRMGLH